MSGKTGDLNFARAAAQMIEAHRAAGVTHVARVTAIKNEGRAEREEHGVGRAILGTRLIGRRRCGGCGLRSNGEDYVWLIRHQIGRQSGQKLIVPVGITPINHVLTRSVTQFAKPPLNAINSGMRADCELPSKQPMRRISAYAVAPSRRASAAPPIIASKCRRLTRSPHQSGR